MKKLFEKTFNLSAKRRPIPFLMDTYPQNSFLGLPLELLYKIILNLELSDWLSLCLTCHALHYFIDKFFLYHDVKLSEKECLIRFRKTLSKNKKVNKLSLYVKRIEFCRPSKEFSQREDNDSMIGFNFGGSSYTGVTYIGLLLEIISYLPNVIEISLTQISPGFQFPDWTSSLNTYAHEHNYYPSIGRLSLSSENGWNIALRPNLLWPFGLIEELELTDMIIDSNSLLKPKLLTVANKNGPLIYKNALTSDSQVTWSPIESLTLRSCSIANNGSRYLEAYFKQVKTLKLIGLKSTYDLLLSHCFSALKNLSIDLNSKCFSLYNANEIDSINVGNINSNFAYFNSKFVPKFYINYPKFEEVINKLPIVSKISLINVSFTNLKPIEPTLESTSETDLVDNNLFKFLKLLSRYDNVEFVMLKNYKLHQSRSRKDWETLLNACFTSTNCVRVKDKDGSILYSRNDR